MDILSLLAVRGDHWPVGHLPQFAGFVYKEDEVRPDPNLKVGFHVGVGVAIGPVDRILARSKQLQNIKLLEV